MCAKIVTGSSKCFVAPISNQNFSFKGDIPYCINLERNAKRGEKERENAGLNLYFHKFANKEMALIKFFNLVKSGGEMDYKKRDIQASINKTPSKYENFGNYNYGVVARSMGIDEKFALACAGAYQATGIMQRALKDKEKTFANLSDEDRAKYELYFSKAQEKASSLLFIKDAKTQINLFHYFINESMKIGDKTGDYGYFDDPKDSKFIKQGYNDAKNLGYGAKFDIIKFEDVKLENVIGELLSQNEQEKNNFALNLSNDSYNQTVKL